MSLAARAAGMLAMALVIGLIAPVATLAHSLNATFESRLPLIAYIAGAAGAVALSFLFVLLRPAASPATIRGDAPAAGGGEGDPGAGDAGSTVLVPRWLRLGLRTIGLIGWIWIVVQGAIGGTSDAAVDELFVWIYGWVGVALISAFVGPVWTWLDPFTTLFDLAALVLRRGGGDPDPDPEPDLGVGSAADLETDLEDPEPPRLPFGRWPAAVGLAVVVWLELVLGGGGSMLFVFVLGFTVIQLAGMALYGRDAWRANGDTFSVWFGLLGRLAPLALTAGNEGRLRRRGFATGILDVRWELADIVIVALGVGSILFDGLSQTQIFFDIFGLPWVPAMTLILAGFMAIVVGLAWLAAAWVGRDAAGAGLLPIAVGYLAAHYLTYLLVDGQRILVAVSDPFQQGWDLFGTAFFEPSASWLPPGLVWTFQLLAVVGGHMIGAWAGHSAVLEEETDLGVDGGRRERRLRQVPLAVVMVILTTVTLWSLGQAVVKTPSDGPTAAVVGSAEAPRD